MDSFYNNLLFFLSCLCCNYFSYLHLKITFVIILTFSISNSYLLFFFSFVFLTDSGLQSDFDFKIRYVFSYNFVFILWFLFLNLTILCIRSLVFLMRWSFKNYFLISTISKLTKKMSPNSHFCIIIILKWLSWNTAVLLISF